ncbi:MAG: hypothetical protein RMK91_08155 [Pseudanabaenaceae cyanobacterium SKYGB_i_bin29]|nr:hypothetical protein [Pseudanabaenaceae cyanobacterium SKYG29]MDW8421827.1 hypothetical protein [Pseudanabaenaceae cyanobacterium SKYGB_i_bin29]
MFAVFWEYIFDHLDDVLAVMFSQFLKVWFSRWLDRCMRQQLQEASQH